MGVSGRTGERAMLVGILDIYFGVHNKRKRCILCKQEFVFYLVSNGRQSLLPLLRAAGTQRAREKIGKFCNHLNFGHAKKLAKLPQMNVRSLNMLSFSSCWARVSSCRLRSETTKRESSEKRSFSFRFCCVNCLDVLWWKANAARGLSYYSKWQTIKKIPFDRENTQTIIMTQATHTKARPKKIMNNWISDSFGAFVCFLSSKLPSLLTSRQRWFISHHR